MLISDVKVESLASDSVLSAKVSRPDIETRIVYRFRDLSPEVLSTRGDTFLANALVPAMRAGEDLQIGAAVSPVLQSQVDQIQALLTAWAPQLSRVNVEASSVRSQTHGSGVGLFFTGGVDSYYSLLKNIENHPEGPHAITHLIFALGIERPEGYERTPRDRIPPMIQEIAHKTGKQPIIVECSLRGNLPHVSWMLHHGSALISIALALQPLLKRCVIASSWYQQDLVGWGSHPELDPLWSTETTEIVHDGIDATRAQKVSTQVAHSDLALRTLRVCFEPEQQPLNCGRCGKCIQTMIILHNAGVLDSCTSFVAPLSVRRMYFMQVEGRQRAIERRIEELGQTRLDRRMARALRFAIRFNDVKQLVKKLVTRKP